MKRIHINSLEVRRNMRRPAEEQVPVIAIRQDRCATTYHNAVRVNGPCRIVYRPDAPLPCGAKVWIETDAEVDGAL